jgi:hypothetical protein
MRKVELHVHIPVRRKAQEHLFPSPERKSNEGQYDDVVPKGVQHDAMEFLVE